jgi:UDP-N-acetylglucosamine 2-epimerase (non-hydrolysing)
MHPRSRKMMTAFGLQPGKNIILTEPVDFFSFLQLESGARLVLTDSGGVQEETCILHVPCVTLRDNTERPETVEVGANILAGAAPEKILECARLMLRKKNDWENPFGDGTASRKIVKILEDKL